MADLDNGFQDAGEQQPLTETLAAMERRHKAEIRKLEGETRALLKTAKKSNRAIIEAQVIQMQYDLKAQQREELDALDAAGGPVEENAAEEHVPDNEAPRQTEEDVALAKKEKAKRKQDKRKAKDAEKAAVRQFIQEANSGPSSREIELGRINQQLTAEQLHVTPILSDGNCLYRAIADQLQLGGLAEVSHDFNSLRGIAASYMRAHPEEFCPFLGLELGDAEFDAYCDKTASLTQAEWGGQLELKALSAALQRPIWVYSADAPVLKMTEHTVPASAVPLRVAFHKHYYSLGEHYNSVAPL